jgi:hypothetical protein
MKNPVLPCLLFLCMGAIPVTAQRYQGVSIRNGKTKQHKDPAHWTHEVQVAVKFPSARGVSHSPWFSKANLEDFTTYFTGANLAYYASPGSKYSFGMELYYDVNKRAEIDQNNRLQSVHKDMLSALLQVRYYWYKPGDPGDENYWLYSGAGVGASTTQTIIRGISYYPLDEEFQDWKYKSNFQYQVVVLGMIGGLANFRFVGELGYGTMFVVKAGVNYRFPSR